MPVSNETNFLSHSTPSICSQIGQTVLSLCECKLVFCSVIRRVYVGRIYSSIAKDSQFDWSIQVTWKRGVIGNQIRLSKRFSFEHIRWYSNTKAVKYSSCYLFLSASGQVVYFHEPDYYCIIWSHYLYAEVLQNRCLKIFAQFAGKHLCQSLFLISH